MLIVTRGNAATDMRRMRVHKGGASLKMSAKQRGSGRIHTSDRSCRECWHLLLSWAAARTTMDFLHCGQVQGLAATVTLVLWVHRSPLKLGITALVWREVLMVAAAILELCLGRGRGARDATVVRLRSGEVRW